MANPTIGQMLGFYSDAPTDGETCPLTLRYLQSKCDLKNKCGGKDRTDDPKKLLWSGAYQDLICNFLDYNGGVSEEKEGECPGRCFWEWLQKSQSEIVEKYYPDPLHPLPPEGDYGAEDMIAAQKWHFCISYCAYLEWESGIDLTKRPTFQCPELLLWMYEAAKDKAKKEGRLSAEETEVLDKEIQEFIDGKGPEHAALCGKLREEISKLILK